MIKSQRLDSDNLPHSLKNSFRSKWLALLIVLPIASYVMYLFNRDAWVAGIMTLFPIEKDKSVAFYADFLNLIFDEMLWLSVFVFVAWALYVYVPLNKIFHGIEWRLVKYRNVFVPFVIITSFFMSLWIAYDTLEAFPNSSDEYAYLYQAKTMGEGKLVESSRSLPKFFHYNHIAQKDGVRVSRFPPGWPAVLSIAFWINISPFLINPILGAIGLWIFYLFAKSVYNDRIALWSLPAMAISSFYIFNSASLFSHTSCMVAALVFVFGVYEYQRTSKVGFLVLSGLFLGLMITIRYYTAVIVFIPFAGYFFYRYQLKAIKVFFFIGLGVLPCFALMLWYQYAITGNPLLPVTMWAYDDESLGFVRGHTVVKGVEHLVRWSCMFLYWSSPGLFILFFVYLFRKVSNKASRFVHPEDYLFPLLTIGYFFYYQIGGNQYGPRFFFEALPFLTAFVVARIVSLRERWAMALFISGMLFAVVKIPSIAARENLVVRERNDLYDLVTTSGIENAVIFVSSHTSVIRPMPIGDLTRNDFNESNNILYVQDLKERNIMLMNEYPEKKYYRYEKPLESSKGQLVEIKP